MTTTLTTTTNDDDNSHTTPTPGVLSRGGGLLATTVRGRTVGGLLATDRVGKPGVGPETMITIGTILEDHGILPPQGWILRQLRYVHLAVPKNPIVKNGA